VVPPRRRLWRFVELCVELRRLGGSDRLVDSVSRTSRRTEQEPPMRVRFRPRPNPLTRWPMGVEGGWDAGQLAVCSNATGGPGGCPELLAGIAVAWGAIQAGPFGAAVQGPGRAGRGMIPIRAPAAQKSIAVIANHLTMPSFADRTRND
jgi:hypothetical protein